MPPATSGRKETLGRRAYRDLRRRILSGELASGQRLSLRAVARSLRMSLAPVGEALRDLAHDGLIETETGWGARVRKLGADDLRNQHILRAALECEAIRHATERASRSQLGELMKLGEELDRRIDGCADPARVCDLDSGFHLHIAQLSGASSLVEALKANQLVRLLARGSLIAHRLERPGKQHVVLVQAMKTRDRERAERAVREHCVRSMELQLRHMPTGETEM